MADEKSLNSTGLSYLWSKLKVMLANKAEKVHTHTKSQITDFPTSMPASDVSSWAKASTKPKYTASEVGAEAAGADVDCGIWS